MSENNTEIKDNTAENISENTGSENVSENVSQKKSKIGGIITIIVIALILAGFGGIVYYNSVYLPNKKFIKMVGYDPSKYINPHKLEGFDYEITQKDFDDSLKEETNGYEDVNRAIKKTDQVDFSYTGYVNGKKDKNISFPDSQIVVGEETNDVLKKFSDAFIGHKKGDTITVKGLNATSISNDKSDYSNKKADFKIKIKNIGELFVEKVTNKWVRESYGEEIGIVNKKDFYNMIETDLEDKAKEKIWRMALDKTAMNSYPQEVYNEVVDEFNGDAQYRAKDYNMTAEEYLAQIEGYTSDTLNDEYNREIKSEILMWYLVKDKDFTCTDEEIEQKYEEYSEELGYDSVSDMKKDYDKKEMREAVYLQKAKDYVFNKANVKKSYNIPK